MSTVNDMIREANGPLRNWHGDVITDAQEAEDARQVADQFSALLAYEAWCKRQGVLSHRDRFMLKKFGVKSLPR